MPEMITCPSCQTSTSDEFNFCRHCKNQIKCLNKECGRTLIIGEPLCLYCGETVPASQYQTQQNKFIHDVKQKGSTYEEHTEFLFSDHVATELAPFIGGQMARRQPLPTSSQVRRANVPVSPTPLALTEGPAEQENTDVEQAQTMPEPSPADGTPQGSARLFQRDGDILLADTKDYKGTNWAEQQRRFIVLYAAAYEQLLGKPVSNKDHFKRL